MPRYEEGQLLSLQTAPQTTPIIVRIHKCHTPWTLSATLVVDVVQAEAQSPLPDRAFLKLYDRRFSHEYRKKWYADDWAPEVERGLLESSRNGEAKAFLEKWSNPEFEFDESWDAVTKEMCLSDLVHYEYVTETEVYDELRKHQGTLIPKFYCAVTLNIDLENGPLGESPVLFDVHGILMEYLDGFRASEIAKHTDKADWNYLVNRASKVVGQVLHDSDVLHKDVRPANMMVCPDETGERGYRLVLIDFGRCRFREDGETEAEWGLAKHRTDEEGAMGCIMQLQLEDVGFEADFKRPNRWIEFAEKERDEYE